MIRKLFLHPVLQKDSTDYIDNSFFDVEILARISDDSENNFVIFDVNVLFSNQKIDQLLKTQEAAIFISVYCPDTMFRKTIQIDATTKSIELPWGELIGNIYIHSNIIALIKLDYFVPSGINNEYTQQGFQVLPGMPLAIGTPKLISVRFKKAIMLNLIKVVRSEELDPAIYEITFAPTVITINMGNDVFNAYELLRHDANQRHYLYTSIYKDVFVEGLFQILSNDEASKYPWGVRMLELASNTGILLTQNSDHNDLNKAALQILAEKGFRKVLSSVDED